MNNPNILGVGSIMDGAKNHPESTLFILDDLGMNIIVFYKAPTEDEMNQFDNNKPFQIGFTKMKNVIFFTVKMGNLNWMDCPHNPHLYPQLSKIEIPKEPKDGKKGPGSPIHLFLVDTVNGEIKKMRQITLNYGFSIKLLNEIIDKSEKTFSLEEFNQNIQEISNKYSTNDLVHMCKDYFKLRLK